MFVTSGFKLKNSAKSLADGKVVVKLETFGFLITDLTSCENVTAPRLTCNVSVSFTVNPAFVKSVSSKFAPNKSAISKSPDKSAIVNPAFFKSLALNEIFFKSFTL